MGGDPDRQAFMYTFSSGFQNQICSSKTSQTCWGAQGISSYGDYITRSFYEKGLTVEAKNPQAKYFAIVVMNKTNARYSNILVRNGLNDPNECHAGDHALDKRADGVFWFFVACTNHISIFSEEHIKTCDDSIACTMEGKRFYFSVEGDKVKNVPISLKTSYISRNHGAPNEFWVGSYDSDEVTALNLQRISFEHTGGAWSIRYLDKDSDLVVQSSYAKKVQGATRIGDHMLLTTSNDIRKCNLTTDSAGKRTLDWCMQQCLIPCTTPYMDLGTKQKEKCPKRIVLQGAETDDSGHLFLASEWNAAGMPFFEISSLTTTFTNQKTKLCIDLDADLR